jgi:hypothetical protein
VPPRPHADEIRLLGRFGGFTDRFAYALRSGAVIEPEVISAEFERTLAARAANDRAAARALTRADLAAASAGVRLARCKAMARAKKVDVHRELRLIRLAVEGGRKPEHIAKRLAVLERRLWPDLPA